jgi:hypothetical protein
MVGRQPGGSGADDLGDQRQAVLQGEAHKLTFVEYLRLSFQWGGFPGWEKYENRPEKELAFLREGLLPI